MRQVEDLVQLIARLYVCRTVLVLRMLRPMWMVQAARYGLITAKSGMLIPPTTARLLLLKELYIFVNKGPHLHVWEEIRNIILRALGETERM